MDNIAASLPRTIQIKFVVAVKRNPSGRHGGSVQAGRQCGASDGRLGNGDECNAEIVERALTVTFPVEGISIVARGGNHQVDVSVIQCGGRDGVRVATTVVVGDIEGVRAAVVGGGTDAPFVGVGAIFEREESVLSGVLEVAVEGQADVAVGSTECFHTGGRSAVGADGGDIDIIVGSRGEAGDGER